MGSLLTGHLLANFLPDMPEEEFEALKADIKEHGQQEPIVYHQGEVLDGRHRLRACQELKIAPKTKEWDGSCGSPLNYVVSMNVFRRHLDESKRALLAAMVRNQSGNVSRNQTTEVVGKKPELSFQEAADLVGVSDRTVKDATVVLKRGTPAEVVAVAKGETTVSTVAKEIRSGKSPTQRAAARRRKTPVKPKNAAAPTSVSADPEQIEMMLGAPFKGDETSEESKGGELLPLRPTAVAPEQGMNNRGKLTPAQPAEVKVLASLDHALALLAELPEDATYVALIAFSSNFRAPIESRVFKVSDWLSQFCAEWQKERAAQVEEDDHGRAKHRDEGVRQLKPVIASAASVSVKDSEREQ